MSDPNHNLQEIASQLRQIENDLRDIKGTLRHLTVGPTDQRGVPKAPGLLKLLERLVMALEKATAAQAVPHPVAPTADALGDGSKPVASE